jgi:RNA polymerase primary sigma factor
MINDMGIQVFETAPDADALLMAEETASADEDAAEAAAQALATVESEIGRTTDPVRMYMREMGTVELLTREGEIVIAKRIEEGINQVQSAVAEYPGSIAYLIDEWDKYEAEQIRLADIVSGFIDPNEAEDLAPTATHVGSELDDDNLADEDEESSEDAEEDTGIDPEFAKEQFVLLNELYQKMLQAQQKSGFNSNEADTALLALTEHFQTFRLIPKLFDKLVGNMRSMMDKVRVQERLIMKNAVEYAKMPKIEFMRAFAGDESSYEWLNKAIDSGKDYSAKLAKLRPDIERCIAKLEAIEAETQLDVHSIKDINRRMAIGEAKARRAKKEMVEANLRLVISIAKKIHQPWFTVLGFNPRR